MFRFSSGLSILPLLLTAITAAAAPFRLAVVELSLPRDEQLVKTTVDKALTGVFSDGIELKSWPYEELNQVLRNHRADAVIGTAGHLTRLTGAALQPIATIVHNENEDPNHNEGTAIVVRRDRSDLRTLADLKGKRAAANSPLGFAGYILAMGEIARFSPDPQHFFSSVDFMRAAKATETIAQSVLSGKTDAGLLRLCALEDFEATHPEVRGELRVINQRQSNLGCAHSTELYPGFTLAVTAAVPPETARRLAVALLSMPPTESGAHWSLPTDFRGIQELYRSLKTGPYEYLSVWSFEGLLKRYLPSFLALVVLIGALGLHRWRSRVLLRRRDQIIRTDLDRLNQRQMKETVAVGAELLVKSLSGPTTSAVHSLLTLKKRLEPLSASDEELLDSAVRDLKSIRRRLPNSDASPDTAPDHALLDVVSLLKKALAVARPSFNRHAVLSTDFSQEKLTISGQADALQLAFVYLLKNAVRGSISPEHIAVTVRRHRDQVVISIKDDAPWDDRDLPEDAETILSVMTPESMRLGIVQRVVSRHGGMFSLQLNPVAEGGITASVTLPLV